MLKTALIGWPARAAAVLIAGVLSSAAFAANWADVVKARKAWWSLQPVRKPAIPDSLPGCTSDNPIDRFVLAKLSKARLHPAPPADRATLCRRLCYVLTGLPPRPVDIARFQSDTDPNAYDRLVDFYLSSPHFGEHWARHWMDVVRYGDTYGYEWDLPAKGAWRYRDYLIRAFNQDVAYDQFIREQLAGDLLASPRIDPVAGINESKIGTMFYQLGEHRHGDSGMQNGVHQEMLNNKIDAFSRALQATTVACAKCHDHKLDAVSQHDYYAMAGVFMSARWVANTLDTPARNGATIAHLKEIKRELRREIGAWWLTSGMGILPMPKDIELPTVSSPSKDNNAAHGQDAHATETHPFQEITKAVASGKSVRDAWEEQKAAYAKLSAERTAANAKDFSVVADFSHGLPPGWTTDGTGLADGPVRSGDFTVALQGDSVVGRIMPGGFFTDSLSPRLNGALRSPFLHFDQPILSIDVAGGDLSAERVIVDNAFLTERQSYLKSEEPSWRSVKYTKDLAGWQTYIEYATKASNPNFPPRWGLGVFLTKEMIEDPRSWFGVTRIVSQATPGKPADELGRFASLFDGPPPVSMDEVKQRYSRWFANAVQAWTEDRADDEQVRLLNWLVQQKLLPNATPPANVAKLVESYRATEKLLLDPETANGMCESDPPTNFPLQIRGDYDRLGDPVPRGFLELFDRPPALSQSSGRRELAEFVASPADPLTARVYVNRVWQWMYGAGLVSTPDDFGHLGDRPSNPDLLDFLSTWFMENGWSTHKLIRLMATSQTFRQSSHEDPAAMRADPDNRMLHHYTLRRLEAESIRDAILSVSGRLDPRLFGPPVNPYRQHEDLYKRLFTGPLDGDGRRSIYTAVSIMEPPEFLATFNQPAAKLPTGKRDVTNVPAQSLALMNDPFVIEQAERWASALVAQRHRSIEERLGVMFRTALGREPTAHELTRWVVLVNNFGADHAVAAGKILDDKEVWKDVAHTIFNMKEFIYLR